MAWKMRLIIPSISSAKMDMVGAFYRSFLLLFATFTLPPVIDFFQSLIFGHVTLNTRILNS